MTNLYMPRWRNVLNPFPALAQAQGAAKSLKQMQPELWEQHNRGLQEFMLGFMAYAIIAVLLVEVPLLLWLF